MKLRKLLDTLTSVRGLTSEEKGKPFERDVSQGRLVCPREHLIKKKSFV